MPLRLFVNTHMHGGSGGTHCSVPDLDDSSREFTASVAVMRVKRMVLTCINVMWLKVRDSISLLCNNCKIPELKEHNRNCFNIM